MSHHEDRNAHAAFEDSTYAGCHGASCNQGRQPCRDRCGAEMACNELDKLRPLVRRPEPRKPHLPLWARVKLEWQHQRVRVLLGVVSLISMAIALAGVAALTFFR